MFDSGLRRFDAAGDAWRPEWVCYYFINDSATPVVRRRRLGALRHQAARAGVPSQPVHSSGDRAVPTRLTSPSFNQLIESRDAQFGALAGVRFAEGLVVREPLVRDTLFKDSRRGT